MDEILEAPHYEYTGKVQPIFGQKDPEGHPLYPYLPSTSLVEAVNLAIYLERPLLLKGEPGCGKTRLARAIAFELELPYEPWPIKSTSRARDGLYIYDAVGRLRDAQLAATGYGKDVPDISNPMNYIEWGPLGRAFVNEQRTVVLIDEIDKADIDFPNDLLLELDESRFFIEEIRRKEVRANKRPIVLITSNDEKDLPDAFLRRCLFHFVDFPGPQRLREVVNAHFPAVSDVLVNAAVKRFLQLREAMKEKGEAGKRVSTSELIDWFRVLQRYPLDEVLSRLKGTLPYPSILLKSWDDHRLHLVRMSQDVFDDERG